MSLSEEDEGFIHRNYETKSPLEIAKYIEQPVDIIKAYIAKITSYEPCEELRNSTDWQLKAEEFTPKELMYFEQSYKKYREQMGDILPTEDRQLIQAVELEVFMHRNKKHKKRAEEDITLIEHKLKRESVKSSDDRNEVLISDYERQLASLRASIPSLSKEYNEHNAKHSSLLKDLKSTRHQRIQELSDAKTNILGLLKKLKNDDFKREQAINLQLMMDSFKKEEEKLSSLHTFVDNSVSVPILNHETITKVTQVE